MASTLMATGAVVAIRRRLRSSFVGSFRLLDALTLWTVSEWKIQAVELGEFSSAYCTSLNGGYQRYEVRAGAASLTIKGRDLAEKCTGFLRAVAWLRHESPADLRAEALANPTLLSFLAVSMSSGQGEIDWSRAETAPSVTPYVAAGGAPSLRLARLLAPVLVLAVLAAWFLPAVRENLRDEFLYDSAVQSARGTTAMDLYLRERPRGRHAAEVAALRDTRRFQIASSEAASLHSPSRLRDYLAVRANTLHRGEAQVLIDGYYREAIQRVRTHALGPAVRQELLSGLIAILEGLRTASDPIVPVRFLATTEVAPGGKLREQEEDGVDALWRETPELRSRKRSAVTLNDVGSVFSERQVRFRELLILDRLQSACKSVLNTDIIGFRLAEPTDDPGVEVRYATAPSGMVFTWTQQEDARPRLGARGDHGQFRGLLRGYLITWHIALQGRGDTRRHIFRVTSNPAEEVRWTTGLGDPSWAPYAIMLTSAYYDFSKQVIEGCGLTAPPAPSSFTLADSVAR